MRCGSAAMLGAPDPPRREPRVPSVPSLINEFWAELPNDVRELRILARTPDVPTDAVRIGYFQQVTSLTQSALKGSGYMLQGTEADQFRAELRSLRERTTRFARWSGVLHQERVGGTPDRDTLVRIACQLSARDDDPRSLSPGEASAIARWALEKAAQEREAAPSRVDALDALLRTNSAAFEQLLTEVWAERPDPQPGRSDRGFEEALLGGLSWDRDESLAAATSAAEAAWQDLVHTFSSGENASDEQLRSVDLSAVAPLTRPALTGRTIREDADPPGTPQRPLSRNIRARLSAVLSGNDHVTPPPPSVEIIEQTIRASPLPYALSQPDARAALHVATRVGWVLSYKRERPGVRDPLLDLDGALGRVHRAWASAAKSRLDSAGRRREQALAAFTPQKNASLDSFGGAGSAVPVGVADALARMENLERYVADGSGYMMGKVWTRLLRSSLLSDEPMGAAEMWAAVYGGVVSAIKTMLDVASWKPKVAQTSGAEVFFARAARHPDIGFTSVMNMWKRIAEIPPRAHLPRDVKATLEEWTLLLLPNVPRPDTRALKAHSSQKLAQLREQLGVDDLDDDGEES